MAYEIGASASRTKTITDEDIRGFATISTDTNPIHLDEDYAKDSMFGQRIAHGMLTASLISAVLANDLPGPGTIYLNQTMKFTKPVFIGDTITATCTIKAIKERSNIVTFDTVITNQDGENVLEGEAVVKAP
jgi:3-hydroxybutyryl-CoA dehydratase